MFISVIICIVNGQVGWVSNKNCSKKKDHLQQFPPLYRWRCRSIFCGQHSRPQQRELYQRAWVWGKFATVERAEAFGGGVDGRARARLIWPAFLWLPLADLITQPAVGVCVEILLFSCHFAQNSNTDVAHFKVATLWFASDALPTCWV